MYRTIVGGVVAILCLIAIASMLSAASASLDAGRSLSSPMYPKTLGDASSGTMCGPKILRGWQQPDFRRPKIVQVCP